MDPDLRALEQRLNAVPVRNHADTLALIHARTALRTAQAYAERIPTSAGAMKQHAEDMAFTYAQLATLALEIIHIYQKEGR